MTFLSKKISPFIAAVALILVFQACDTKDPFSFRDDFTTVPDALDTTSALRSFTYGTGLTYYVIEEGSGPFQVTEIDQVNLFYTLRTTNGQIVQSSWANGNVFPTYFSLPNTIRGFREGMVGMKEGEKRVIIIPPPLAYGNNPGSALRNDTLMYDIVLTEIID